MKKFLALTDFSDDAQKAIDYGLLLAQQCKADSFTVLHSFEPAVLYQTDSTGGMMPDGTPNMVNYTLMAEEAEAINKANHERMKKLEEELKKTHPNIPLKLLIEEGFLGDIANDLIEKEQIDMTIMGIKGKSGLEKIIVGSNAVKAIDGIESPLLIIPHEAQNQLPAKVALATDLELLSDKALARLTSFLNGLGTPELLVVNVNHNNNDAEIEERVSAIKAQLQPLNPVIHLSEAESVEAGLEEFTAQNNISVLVFIHHERSFFSKLFHKSIGKQIAWNTTIPVLRLKN